MSKFVHLHTHSHYSLLDGLPKIDELVHRTKELGMDAVALTDHGNLYGAIEFYKKAKAAGIKPILGVEAYIAPNNHQDKSANGEEKYYHLTLLVQNNDGWKNLIRLVTRSHLDGFYYRPRMDKEMLREHGKGLIALSGCLGGEISRLLAANNMQAAVRVAREYQEIFGPDNFYIEISHHPGIKETVPVQERLRALSKETGIPLAATQDIHYLKKEDAEYHDVLLAVQTGNKVGDPDRLTLKQDDFSMKSPEEMEELFSGAKNLSEAIENTVKIGERCNAEIELGKIKLPKFPLPEGEASANKYLEKILRERITNRYPVSSKETEERLTLELGVIERMGFADYFLIVQDFVNWAKERGIVVGPGRGSAAGSIVSYILGITDIDPLKYDLLFERFLNPERIQMPDIDIDITDVRRDEVIGYLREKYGEDRVANIITFGTMAARAAVRDVGRALGVNYSLCDQTAKLVPFNMNLEKSLESVAELRQLYENNDSVRKILDSARHLEGVARHASVHACGIVIGNEPLTNYIPLQRSPQDPNVIITQFEMHAVEDLGLLKMDILGLRNLTIIEETVRLVEELRTEKIEISRLPLDDKKTFSMLQAGNTVGVFQLESSGMTRYLKELKPTELEDIIAMISLYRPGPMELIPEYIARKHGRRPVQYLHPKLEPVLKNTYGIMIYQEQLMNAARVLAGFSLAEADVLRKAVGKKIRKLLQEQKNKLISGCLENGVPQAIAERFWELIEPFDRYGFNRSHGAAYAMIAYETAYLKARYPVEFMTALLNAESGDIERTAFLVTESKKTDIEVLPPDINKSGAVFMPDLPAEASAKARGKNIRFGLSAIKNVGENIVQAIIENRERHGPFKDLASLLTRVQHKDLNKKSLESLIKCGALDSFGIERNQALSNIEELIRFASTVKKEGKNGQTGLFGNQPSSLKLKDAPPASLQEKLRWEKELLGLYVTEHPLNNLKPKIEQAKAKPITEVLANPIESQLCRVAGLVCEIKRVVTKNGKQMLFARVEDAGDALEVIVFTETLAKKPAVWRENLPVLILGRMSTRNGETKMICEEATEL